MVLRARGGTTAAAITAASIPGAIIPGVGGTGGGGGSGTPGAGSTGGAGGRGGRGGGSGGDGPGGAVSRSTGLDCSHVKAAPTLVNDVITAFSRSPKVSVV